MHPVPFHIKERVVAPPVGQHEAIAGLRVVDVVYEDGTPAMVSCWQLTDEDIEEILRTRKIYHVSLGRIHTPVCLTASKFDCGIFE